MKALTIQQPYASLIALGLKTIETRSWSTRHRGRIAIHAGAAVAEDADKRCWSGIESTLGPRLAQPVIPTGAVIATAKIADCVPMIGPTNYTNLPQVTSLEVWADVERLVLWTPTQSGYPRMADKTDQLPYGAFKPGRWAWLLEEVEPIEPVEASGRRRLWNWYPAMVTL